MTAQVIYADTLFALNFAMNFLSLFLCGCLLHMRRSFLPLALSAALGGALAVAEVLLGATALVQCLLSIPQAFLLVSLGYRKTGTARRYLSLVLLFFWIAVLLGGAVNLLQGWLYGILGPHAITRLRLADTVLLLGLLASMLLYFAARAFRAEIPRTHASISVRFLDRAVSVSALVDSGCLLTDPISGKPAVIVRMEALVDILPSEIVACARSQGMRIPQTSALARRCRFLPAKGIGNAQILLSIRPDRLTVTTEDQRKCYECEALVALIDCGRERFAGCDGLLPSNLLL